MGKGSRFRRQQIPDEIIRDNWDKVFKKKIPKKEDKKEQKDDRSTNHSDD